MPKADSPSSQYARDDVASNLTQYLTTAELQDLAVAATAQSEPEAMALEESLEDAGIPVCMCGGTNLLGIQEPRKIWVPRSLLPAAQERIAKFRAEHASPRTTFRAEDELRLRRRLNEGLVLIALGALLFAASFFIPANETGRITIIFGVPTMITGLCVVLAAKHMIERRRK